MTNDVDDHDLDPDHATDRRILAAIPVVAPPAGFTDGVVAAARASRALRARSRRVAAVLSALLVGGMGFAWWHLRSHRELAGRRRTTAVETLALGKRALVVAQPATELEWAIRADGAASITQSRGNAFYRVAPGAAFAVTTPAGRVLVQGTCFGVEMDPMTSTQKAAATAILAGAALVTVYEGHVLLQTEGVAVPLAAGDSGLLRAGEPPTALPMGRETAPGPEALTRELASLRMQVKSLEDRLAGVTTYGAGTNPSVGAEYFGFSPAQLGEMAERCEIRADMPPYGLKPGTLGADDAARFGLGDAERAIYDRIVAARSAQFLADMRALYVELTGDDAGAGVLELSSLEHEIARKSSEEDQSEATRRLSQERARLVPPRSDLRGGSVYERYLRLLLRAGDDLERDLAREIGASKAKSLRQLHGGFVAASCNP